MAESQSNIQSSLQENRLFATEPAFGAKAHIKSRQQYDELYRKSIDHPEEFWADAAKELHFFEPWQKVLEWNRPHAKWFVGAKTNVAYNCLDRQIALGRGEKTAILW